MAAEIYVPAVIAFGMALASKVGHQEVTLSQGVALYFVVDTEIPASPAICTLAGE
jgi:hypothetical protein